MILNRRNILLSALATGVSGCTSTPKNNVFSPTWESLGNYKRPSWFNKAKFGIWAHWGPQCVPEFGDWYGRQMYMEGNPFYKHHIENYGHPSETGFIDIITKFKAENWQPERLIKKYKAAGAKYFVAMANHHDNFDMYDSKYHSWNSTRIGPKKDIIGTWAKLAREEGLRFGVSNHSGHAWHWWQTAYGYDTLGKYKGKRYDAFTLSKADGMGKEWQGLDPQTLYCGKIPSMVAPDGFLTPDEMQKFHDIHSGDWSEKAPIENPLFTKNWLLRQNDLIEKYRPDYVYFDNYGLPLENAGLMAAANFYNKNTLWNGTNQAVITGKKLDNMQMNAIIDDVEKGFLNDKRPLPWQTCTCIGNWHYDRSLYNNKSYKSAKNIVQRLIDVVSKNGNLLLSIPMRGDGSIDSEEEKILDDIASWMTINSEAIFETTTFITYGYGPTKFIEGMQNEQNAGAFTVKDVRFTQKNNVIYAMPMEWGDSSEIEIILPIGFTPKKVTLLGDNSPLSYLNNKIKLPAMRTGFLPVFKFEI